MSYRDGTDTMPLPPNGVQGSQCLSNNAALANDPSSTQYPQGRTFTVRFKEFFGTAFQPRSEAAWPDADSPPAPTAQTYPGRIYQAESGFYNPAFPATDGLNVAGLADSGTRLYILLENVPTGVKAFTGVYEVGKTAANSRIRNIAASAALEDREPIAVSAPTTSLEGGMVPFTPLPGNKLMAVFEVTGFVQPQILGQVDVPVAIAYDASSGGGAGVIQARAGLGPRSAIDLASATEPVPRFAASSNTTTVYTIAPCTAPVTIASTLAGVPQPFNFTVSGTGCLAGSYTTPTTFNWTPGTPCTVSMPTPVSAAPGTQYVLGGAVTRWSDGNDSNPRVIVAPVSAASYTAQYNRQHQVCVSSSPANACTFTIPSLAGSASGCHYVWEGSQSLLAAPQPGYAFQSFSGGLTSTSNPAPFSLSAPLNVVGNCPACVPNLQVQVVGKTDGVAQPQRKWTLRVRNLGCQAANAQITNIAVAGILGPGAVSILPPTSIPLGTIAPSGSVDVQIVLSFPATVPVTKADFAITLTANSGTYNQVRSTGYQYR